MGFIDFILNIAGLLLWLNWRAARVDPMAAARPSTLAGTLRRAGKPRIQRWHFPLALGGLLLARAFIYWQIGSPVNWAASLDLAAITVSFASFGNGAFGHMLLFSILSFGATLGAFLLWMLLLSLLSRPGLEFDGLKKFVRLHIGSVDNWPRWIKLLLPLLGAGMLWWLLIWPLARWGMLPRPVSQAHRVEQSLVIGLASYLAWRLVVVGVLALHLVNSYVYLGSHPFWSNVNSVAQRMLAPLRGVPLRIGRVDFAPVLMIVLVFLLTQVAENGLNVKLPPWSDTPLFRIPGLVDLYRAASS